MHRRADLYPSPTVFSPERFLAPDAPDTYTWVPFGGGTRRCLGASFAQTEMRIVLDRVLARAQLTAADPKLAKGQLRAITLSPKGGVRVIQDRAPLRRLGDTDAALQLGRLGQLLQGPAAVRQARDRVRAPRGRRVRPLRPPRAARRAEPGAAGADAGARRRPRARASPARSCFTSARTRSTCRRTPSSVRRCCSGCSSSSTTTSPTSPSSVSGSSAGIHPPESELEAKRTGGRAALKALDAHLQRHQFLVGERYSIADIALFAYTHVAPEGGFELEPYPGVQAWLARVAAQPGHIAITDVAVAPAT